MNLTDIKNKILRECDIASVVGRYVPLKQKGAEYFGACPFHNERTPSFSVCPKKGIFKCFGCGAGGDVIEFVMRIENKNFVEAVALLANQQHITVTWHERSHYDKARSSEQTITYVPKDKVLQSLGRYDINPFALFLHALVGEDRAARALVKWYVGTARDTGTLFWQVDQCGMVRTASKIHYNGDGHRRKDLEPRRIFTQAHGYVPCLFGEHQLVEVTDDTLIAVVESEKTAILCDLFMPTLYGQPVIYMACCGANGLTDEKARALSGQQVVLIPDFSYASRAAWGAVPMRKKYVDVRGVLRKVVAEDGEVEEGYVSVAQRISHYVKNVSILNDWAYLNDGSDIADVLLDQYAPKTPQLKAV